MNYTRRLTISLTQEEAEALCDLAVNQRRDERAQAATDAADTSTSAASEAPAPDEPAPGTGGAQPAPA